MPLRFSVLTLCILLNCGISVAGKFTVVGGQDAASGEFPFMASLRTLDAGHICGCTFISEQWVVTAAHCAVFHDPSTPLEVEYGTVHFRSLSSNIVPVERVILHENYNPKNFYQNDIAVAELVVPITFNSVVQPIRFLARSSFAPGTSVTLIGWGYVANNGNVHPILQKVNISLFSNAECSTIQNVTIPTGQICAGTRDSGRGQCTGDSGGPLLFGNRQIGIVSWSRKPCGRRGFVGVFINVFHYIQWMRSASGVDIQ